MRVILACVSLCSVGLSAPRLSVDGTTLHDPCGETIILRGANNLIIYPDRAGESTLPGLAASGANVVRAHWRIFSRTQSKPVATPQELDTFISNAWSHGLFSIISVWEASGDRTPDNQWHDVVVRWWTSPEIVAVVRKHESHLIVNIANEWDRDDMPDIDFNRRVAAAVREMREAGIRTSIMVDADGYGRNGEGLVDNGPFLLEQDPDRNLIFSWHFYDARMTREDIASLLERANQAGICFVVGEFSRVGEGNPRELQWEALLEEAAKRDIGWLIWDWGSPDPNRVAKFSVTTDNQFGHWANPPWGEAIGEKHPDGLIGAQRTQF